MPRVALGTVNGRAGNLTDRKLKALKPAEAGKRYDVMDTDVRNLGVRVTDKGLRTFILVARFPGSSNPTRRAVGEYPTTTLEKARKTARAWLGLIREGIDPKEDLARKKRAICWHGNKITSPDARL